MKPKLLLTGSNGFIGRNLAKKLSGQYDIVGLCRNMPVHGINIKPEVIIHCGAEMYDEQEMFESNVVFTHELLQLALKAGCKKFIHLGTSSEYGKVARGTIETDRINPTTIYEATKGCGTLLVQAVSRRHGLPGIIIRPYTIYGPYENEKKLIPTLYRSHKKGIPLEFVKLPKHDWTFIDDFTAGIEILLNIDYPPGDIINFGTGVQKTNMEVLQAMEMALGADIPFTEKESIRSYDSDCWVCNNGHAKSKYGITFTTSLKHGLEKYVAWMQKFYG